MKADDDKTDEALWAYLHGELDEARRGEFERELSASEALRDRLSRASRVDLLVRRTLRKAIASQAVDVDAALTDEVLAAWERDQGAAGSVAERADRPPSPRRGWFGRPMWSKVALAAAALAVAVLTPAILLSPKARWADPEFVPLAYRGAAAPAEAHALSPSTAARCQEALAGELARLMEARGAKLPAGLVLSLRVHELRDGAFSVCVRARFCGGREAGEWTGDFSSVEAYVAHAGSSAEAIAKGLIGFSGAGVVGGRP